MHLLNQSNKSSNKNSDKNDNERSEKSPGKISNATSNFVPAIILFSIICIVLVGVIFFALQQTPTQANSVALKTLAQGIFDNAAALRTSDLNYFSDLNISSNFQIKNSIESDATFFETRTNASLKQRNFSQAENELTSLMLLLPAIMEINSTILYELESASYGLPLECDNSEWSSLPAPKNFYSIKDLNEITLDEKIAQSVSNELDKLIEAYFSEKKNIAKNSNEQRACLELYKLFYLSEAYAYSNSLDVNDLDD